MLVDIHLKDTQFSSKAVAQVLGRNGIFISQ